MPNALPLIADMLAGATDVRPLQDAPGKSGARLERLTVGGVGCVVKYLDRAADWTLRASGVLAGPVVTHVDPRPARPTAGLHQPADHRRRRRRSRHARISGPPY